MEDNSPDHEKLKRELLNKFTGTSSYLGSHIKDEIQKTDFKQFILTGEKSNGENERKKRELLVASVKKRFFAQYWGQKVMKKNIEGLENFYSEPDGFIRSMTIDSVLFLELKHLSKLSNEDYSKITELYVKPIFKSKENYIEEVSNFKIFMVEEIDFLRSKGYAVPFMEYSVDDLISFGWVQLI